MLSATSLIIYKKIRGGWKITMSDLITIKYKKMEIIDKEYEIQMKDLHHCFLQGKDEDYNTTEYFGIWTTDKELKICEIKNQDTIKIKTFKNKNIYTYNDIRKFLENHNRVMPINKETFMNELTRMLDKIK